MFSAYALLIMAGFGLVAVLCSIFPVAPTARAALFFFAAAVTCFFLPAYVGILIASGIFGLIILDGILSARQVHVRRTMPHQLARGVAAPFRIATKKSSMNRRAKSGLLATTIRQPRCADIDLSKKEGVDDLQGTITARRRGLHTIPPFATRVTGPLGLARWHRPYKDVHKVAVFPDLPAAQRLAHSVQQGRFATAGLKRRGPLGLGTNFESVREYLPDDDMRLVNWSATARTGRPMANQYRVEQDRDVMVLIDTGRLMTAPLPITTDEIQSSDVVQDYGGELINSEHFATRLDIALDAVCGLVSVADVMGDRAGVVSFDSHVRKHLRPRRAGARAVIHSVYDLEPVAVDSDFEAACQRVGNSKRAFVLILTDFMDARSAEPLVRALRTIVRKHRVVVAGIIDPDVAKIVDSQPTTRQDQLVGIGAQQMSHDTNDAIESIKNAGADVVYAQHGNLVLECVQRYLGAKQRGTF